MTTEWVFIRAHDAWMFRDSKPFSAGQNFFARSQFPPHPGTMQGVIRSHYLETNGIDLAAFGRGEITTPIGTPSGLGDLWVDGPFVGRMRAAQVECLVRTPFDVLKEKRSEEFRILAPAKDAHFITGMPFAGWRPLIIPHQKADEQYEDAGGWLDTDAFERYLKGSFDGNGRINDNALYAVEARVGLAINYGRRTNEESLFYRAQFMRPRDDDVETGDVGLLVGVNQPVFSARGMLRVGGESRMGLYERVTYATPSPAVQGGRLKLVLLTPAYFDAGWCPQPANGVIDWSPWLGNSARLVSMMIGKPLVISGWDLALKAPKPLRHFVPAGSVYYFEDAVAPNKPFTQSRNNEPAYAQMGFGAFAIGTWNYA